MPDPAPSTETADDIPAVDLTSCDREPIHQLGHVQDYGCLIAVTFDWMVCHASRNVADFLGAPAEDLIGQNLPDFLPSQAMHMLRGRVQAMAGTGIGNRVYAFDLLGDGQLFDIAMHETDRMLVIEFERKAPAADATFDPSQMPTLLDRIKRHKDTARMNREIVRMVRAISGFDRVMMYMFDPDGSGHVVAEEKQPDADSLLGLRYPASDIPKQARKLYERSLIRLIWDTDAPTHAIVSAKRADAAPLDLSLAVTRAVSPIHIEYLQNMGVRSSMSVSILQDGKLIGLIACHGSRPNRLDFETRSQIELMVQVFNYELTNRRLLEEQALAEVGRRMHDRFISRSSDGQNLANSIETIRNEMSEAIAFDGISIFSGDKYASRGHAPTDEEFASVARLLNTATANEVFTSHQLGEDLPEALGFMAPVAGMMALPISRSPRDFVVLYRREVAKSVVWAGNPEKAVTQGPNGARLSPRGSFDAWNEIVKGQSAAWSPGEIAIAESLRVTLLEFVLKITDQMMQERQGANKKQEILIAELNHRVRNILNLIGGLASRSRKSALSIEDFTRVLDGRIQALARAHDQLTTVEWTGASLQTLIEIEIAAFADGSVAKRVLLSGTDHRLVAEAFSTLALVVHELMTNSVKYGALSVEHGRVTVSMTQTQGDLSISWREEGGPTVSPPERRGFGRTIIEQAVPHELKGDVEMKFDPEGLDVRIRIPSRYVIDADAPDARGGEQEESDTFDMPSLPDDVLLLEDNLIIALDAEDMLRDLGAKTVHLCNSVRAALDVIEATEIGFAVLDVNLGDETSIEVARALHARGIPHLLATGYGTESEILSEFPRQDVVKKPYIVQTLAKGIASVLG